MVSGHGLFCFHILWPWLNYKPVAHSSNPLWIQEIFCCESNNSSPYPCFTLSTLFVYCLMFCLNFSATLSMLEKLWSFLLGLFHRKQNLDKIFNYILVNFIQDDYLVILQNYFQCCEHCNIPCKSDPCIAGKLR